MANTLDPVQVLSGALTALAGAVLTAKSLPDTTLLQVLGSGAPLDATGKETPGLQNSRVLVFETWKDFTDAVNKSFMSGAVSPVPASLGSLLGAAPGGASSLGAPAPLAQAIQAAGQIVTPVLSALAAGS